MLKLNLSQKKISDLGFAWQIEWRTKERERKKKRSKERGEKTAFGKKKINKGGRRKKGADREEKNCKREETRFIPDAIFNI